MMKGKMLIDLSQEMMISVVQEWFDKHTYDLGGRVEKVFQVMDSDPPVFCCKIVPIEEQHDRPQSAPQS